jgi:allantoicase
MTMETDAVAFRGFTDLASERIGGRALVASDEFFAPKENLLKPGRGIFIPDKFTESGKWMDGWETRRKRTPGHDWCIIKLGLAGEIKGLDIDTNHFLGNAPAYASVDACTMESGISGDALKENAIDWHEILPRFPITPGSRNLFPVCAGGRVTHVRLNIYPDGGVARLRVYGVVLPDWSKIVKGALIDLAAVEHGGLVVAASDMFFGSRENLIMPGRAVNMGDGWETRRRRGPGHDWAIVKLGRPGRIKRIELDTAHFKGNYPDTCSIDVCSTTTNIDALTWPDVEWKVLLGNVTLSADSLQTFESELVDAGEVTHVRLNIFPDGGVSRLRVFGVLV